MLGKRPVAFQNPDQLVWPAKSCDLNPLDITVWHDLKNFIRKSLTSETMNKTNVIQKIHEYFKSLKPDNLFSFIHGHKPGATDEQKVGRGIMSRFLVILIIKT